MACSEAKRAANQANAKKSTGPITEVGKHKSRANAVKHGLSGEGVALPPAMEAEVQEKTAAFERHLRPADDFERETVRRIALSAVRSRHSFHLEMRLTEANRRRDLERFDIDREEAAESLGAHLAEDPAGTVLRLHQTAAGCDWLVDRWENLARGLEEGKCGWNEKDIERALDLLGVRPSERHLDAWATDYQHLWLRATCADATDAAAARQELAERVAAEIAALKELAEQRVRIDQYEYSLLEADARFDLSPEVQQVRRLGAAADRTFDRCLKLLQAREPASASAPPAPSAPPARPPAPESKTKPTAPAPPPAPSRGRDPVVPIPQVGGSLLPRHLRQNLENWMGRDPAVRAAG